MSFTMNTRSTANIPFHRLSCCIVGLLNWNLHAIPTVLKFSNKFVLLPRTQRAEHSKKRENVNLLCLNQLLKWHHIDSVVKATLNEFSHSFHKNLTRRWKETGETDSEHNAYTIGTQAVRPATWKAKTVFALAIIIFKKQERKPEM